MQDFSKTLLQAGKDGEFDINDTDSIIKYIMYKLYPDFYNGSEEFNMDIAIPKVLIGYKLDISKIKKIPNNTASLRKVFSFKLLSIK